MIKYILILLIILLFGCEDLFYDHSINRYSTIKGRVLDSATGEPAFISLEFVSWTEVAIGEDVTSIDWYGDYELPDIETGEQIISATGYQYKPFRDTINVKGKEFLYDIHLERQY